LNGPTDFGVREAAQLQKHTPPRRQLQILSHNNCDQRELRHF
jgi:hypothetical protein